MICVNLKLGVKFTQLGNTIWETKTKQVLLGMELLKKRVDPKILLVQE